eukprot:4954787-Alexandrium_andersonii.AAC.1
MAQNTAPAECPLQSRHPQAHSTAPAEHPLRNRKTRSQNTAPAERPLHRKKSRPPTWPNRRAFAVVLGWRVIPSGRKGARRGLAVHASPRGALLPPEVAPPGSVRSNRLPFRG